MFLFLLLFRKLRNLYFLGLDLSESRVIEALKIGRRAIGFTISRRWGAFRTIPLRQYLFILLVFIF